MGDSPYKRVKNRVVRLLALRPDCQILSFSVFTVQRRQHMVSIVRCFVVHVATTFNNSGDCQSKGNFHLDACPWECEEDCRAAQLCASPDVQPRLNVLLVL